MRENSTSLCLVDHTQVFCHLKQYTLQQPSSKSQETTNAAVSVGEGKLCVLLVKLQSDAATVENSKEDLPPNKNWNYHMI